MKGSSDIAVVQRSLIKLRPSLKVKEAPSEFPALGGSVENSSAEGFGDLPAEDNGEDGGVGGVLLHDF